jgi:hypothetical protein
MFWEPKGGKSCYVSLDGGDPDRSWVVEFEGLKCLGFYFDA